MPDRWLEDLATRLRVISSSISTKLPEQDRLFHGEFEAAWPEQRVGIPTTAEFGPPDWRVIAASDAIAAPERLLVALGLAAN